MNYTRFRVRIWEMRLELSYRFADKKNPDIFCCIFLHSFCILYPIQTPATFRHRTPGGLFVYMVRLTYFRAMKTNYTHPFGLGFAKTLEITLFSPSGSNRSSGEALATSEWHICWPAEMRRRRLMVRWSKRFRRAWPHSIRCWPRPRLSLRRTSYQANGNRRPTPSRNHSPTLWPESWVIKYFEKTNRTGTKAPGGWREVKKILF